MLEAASQVDTVVFDKTGTLTRGRPSLQQVLPTPGSSLSAARLLAYAAAVERCTTHPVAQAIVQAADSSGMHVRCQGLVSQLGTPLESGVVEVKTCECVHTPCSGASLYSLLLFLLSALFCGSIKNNASGKLAFSYASNVSVDAYNVSTSCYDLKPKDKSQLAAGST